MKEINISVGNKSYEVVLAETEEEQRKGLMGVDEMDNDEGMLFVFDEEDEVSIWMKDTEIPLDIVFIDKNLDVVGVYEGVPNSEEFITDTASYVLEVNKDSGIKVGDELNFNTEKNINPDKMLILDSEGKPQMELVGGERIFSRAHTKTLIKFAKKADSTEADKDYKELGKRIFKFLDIQNNTDPEYVKS